MHTDVKIPKLSEKKSGDGVCLIEPDLKLRILHNEYSLRKRISIRKMNIPLDRALFMWFTMENSNYSEADARSSLPL